MVELKINENEVDITQIYVYGSRLPAVPRMSLCLERSSSPSLFAFHFPNLCKRKVTGEKRTGHAKNSDPARANRTRVDYGRLYPDTESAAGWSKVERVIR